MEGQKSPTANTTGIGSAFEHLKHLEVPGQPQGGERGRPESITGSMRGRSDDFAAGYSLGLIGGVRSWVSVPSPHESTKTQKTQKKKDQRANVNMSR